MTNILMPDEHRSPAAQDGTAEFYTGEQVDLHASNLARITAEALDLAEPRHQVTEPTDFDANRVEFGRNVVGTIASAPEQTTEVRTLTDPTELARVGTMLVTLRLAQARESSEIRGA